MARTVILSLMSELSDHNVSLMVQNISQGSRLMTHNAGHTTNAS